MANDDHFTEQKEQNFTLANGNVIRVFVDVNGKLKVTSISNGRMLSVEPNTDNSLSITTRNF